MKPLPWKLALGGLGLFLLLPWALEGRLPPYKPPQTMQELMQAYQPKGSGGSGDKCVTGECKLWDKDIITKYIRQEHRRKRYPKLHQKTHKQLERLIKKLDASCAKDASSGDCARRDALIDKYRKLALATDMQYANIIASRVKDLRDPIIEKARKEMDPSNLNIGKDKDAQKHLGVDDATSRLRKLAKENPFAYKSENVPPPTNAISQLLPYQKGGLESMRGKKFESPKLPERFKGVLFSLAPFFWGTSFAALEGKYSRDLSIKNSWDHLGFSVSDERLGKEIFAASQLVNEVREPLIRQGQITGEAQASWYERFSHRMDLTQKKLEKLDNMRMAQAYLCQHQRAEVNCWKTGNTPPPLKAPFYGK